MTIRTQEEVRKMFEKKTIYFFFSFKVSNSETTGQIIMQELATALASIQADLTNFQTDVDAMLTNVKTKLTNLQTDVDAMLTNFQTNVDAKFTNIQTILHDMVTKVDSALELGTD
jgi:hypothetical protein